MMDYDHHLPFATFVPQVSGCVPLVTRARLRSRFVSAQVIPEMEIGERCCLDHISWKPRPFLHPSAASQKCTGRTPAATTAQPVPTPSVTQEESRSSPPLSADGGTHRSPVRTEDSGEQDGEFVWKAGPAPCRLQGRPSLGLIRHGQVRIMTKALLSCPEAGDEETGESGRSRDEVRVAPSAGFGNSGSLTTLGKRGGI